MDLIEETLHEARNICKSLGAKDFDEGLAILRAKSSQNHTQLIQKVEEKTAAQIG